MKYDLLAHISSYSLGALMGGAICYGNKISIICFIISTAIHFGYWLRHFKKDLVSK